MNLRPKRKRTGVIRVGSSAVLGCVMASTYLSLLAQSPAAGDVSIPCPITTRDEWLVAYPRLDRPRCVLAQLIQASSKVIERSRRACASISSALASTLANIQSWKTAQSLKVMLGRALGLSRPTTPRDSLSDKSPQHPNPYNQGGNSSQTEAVCLRLDPKLSYLKQPNDQKLSHAAGDSRQPETRSGN